MYEYVYCIYDFFMEALVWVIFQKDLRWIYESSQAYESHFTLECKYVVYDMKKERYLSTYSLLTGVNFVDKLYFKREREGERERGWGRKCQQWHIIDHTRCKCVYVHKIRKINVKFAREEEWK